MLEDTYGVILYQEQVMQIAQVLAGYTLGGADLLRRAWARKRPRKWPSSVACLSTVPWPVASIHGMRLPYST